MGFLDSLLGGSENTSGSGGDVGGNPIKITMKFSPFRLAAMKADRVNMVISVKNESSKPQLVSVDVMVPKNGMIGFDTTCASKHCEKKAGEIKPNSSIEIVIPMFAGSQTRQGEYNVNVTAYTHYIDYTKVIHQTKKSTTLRVV